jgi:glycosyltransferase involved in cell wall biosynthesis/multidrug transporter EmrE-like cation transporter
MRVLVVSSYPPRRCGIGAYARDQVRRLRARGHEVTVLSPPDGEGDLRVSFFGGRPFFTALRVGGRFDRILVHFQPALYYRPRAPLSRVLTSLGFLTLVGLRNRRTEVLVHEADPPVRWRPDYVLLRAAFRVARALWFHTEAERRSLEAHYRARVRGGVVPHRVLPVARASRAQARARLGVPERGAVLVCAGFLHPGKGFDRAVEAVRGAKGVTLYVVGSVREPTPENLAYARDLRARCREVPNVRLVERFVTDEEFDLWLAAADRVVLPYRRAWSSGVLARAHALGTPAVVTAVGGLTEQASGRDIVVRDDEELARALREAAPAAEATRGAAPGGRPEEGPVVEGPDWDPGLPAPERAERERAERKGRLVLVGLILVSVGLAALAQLTLKYGMDQVTREGTVPLDLTDLAGTVRRVVLNPFVWGGLFTFVLSAAVWLVVLSRASLSFAYPFASLTYVLILLFDRFVLGQPISALRYGGVALIVAGLVLISRTPQTL